MRALATLWVVVVAACASTSAPRDEVRKPPEAAPSTTAALIDRLLGGETPERIDAESRLLARGPAVAPALVRAAGAADGVDRLRLLGVLDEMGRVPEDVGADERAAVLLWRLGGGNGGASERSRALLRLPASAEDVRAVLARRASRPGPDRAVALFALSRTGDRGAIPVLAEALDTGDPHAREAAAEGLRTLTGVDWNAAGPTERGRLLREWNDGGQG